MSTTARTHSHPATEREVLQALIKAAKAGQITNDEFVAAVRAYFEGLAR